MTTSPRHNRQAPHQPPQPPPPSQHQQRKRALLCTDGPGSKRPRHSPAAVGAHLQRAQSGYRAFQQYLRVAREQRMQQLQRQRQQADTQLAPSLQVGDAPCDCHGGVSACVCVCVCVCLYVPVCVRV